ncbi:hypothetical protein KKF38_00740 [Patescibacteria group bacterium]|nr:hypothetical protein [Patescibacteria group bacterium]
MPQQEVFTPLEEGANINTADGFQIITAKEIIKTGEDKGVKIANEEKEKRMAKFLMDNQVALQQIRQRVELKRVTQAIEE